MNMGQDNRLCRIHERCRSLMDSPMTASIMNNPEMLQIYDEQPPNAGIINQNPDFAHVINDPQILRQAMEAMRESELMREMQRATDRQLSNIEAHPEGFDLLRNMYTNIPGTLDQRRYTFTDLQRPFKSFCKLL